MMNRLSEGQLKVIRDILDDKMDGLGEELQTIWNKKLCNIDIRHLGSVPESAVLDYLEKSYRLGQYRAIRKEIK